MRSLPRASAGSSFRPALAILLAAFVAGACQAAAPSEPVATTEVDLPRSYKFAPADIVVPVGATVTWTNNDNFTHSVRLLESGDVLMMKPGEVVTQTFPSPGLFRYDCSLHPNDMQGSVLVEASSG